MSKMRQRIWTAPISLLLLTYAAAAQTTAFNYQGKLTDNGNPANGTYLMEFKLFDALASGNQVGTTISLSSVAATNGAFDVQLDFGVAAFNGADRFLEVAVKRNAGDPFTILTPRQRINAAPYAVKSKSSEMAINATQLGGVDASQYVTNSTGGSQFIRNDTTQQTANFNISGTGAANILSATTQFNLNGSRVLSTPGLNNLFAGVSAGTNTTGYENAFFGSSAGSSNTIGHANSLFGTNAGFSNTSGRENSFFGGGAGFSNTTGGGNAFFGVSAGFENTASSNNTFIGYFADFNTQNPTGNDNTLLGFNARLSSGVSNGTAIGANATVIQSNSLVLGNNVNVGIGTTAPVAKLTVIATSDSATDNTATFANTTIGPNFSHIHYGTTGDWYVRSAHIIGKVILQDTGGRVGIGTNSPLDKLHVAGDIRVGAGTTGCVKDADATVLIGTCSSDVRLKRDIVPFAHLLDKVVQLQPVEFYWRAEEFKERHFGSRLSYGLIAQEVEQVFPELVTTDDQGYKAVNYSKLPLLSLQAIKELKAENDSLKQKLTEQQTYAALQQQQFQQQQQELAAIKQLLCQSNPQADLCKAKPVK